MDSIKTGLLISECRKEKGLTQRNIAETLNISNRTVSKWENGDGFPDVTLLPQIAQILGITTDELLAGERKAESVKEEPQILFHVVGKSTAKAYEMIYKTEINTHAPVWTRILISVCLVLIIIVANIYNVPKMFTKLGIVLLLFFVLYPLWPKLLAKIQVENEKALNMSDKVVESEMTVLDTGEIILKSPRRTTVLYVNEVTEIFEKKGIYCVKLGKKVYFAIPKNEFVKGDPQDFFDYISSNLKPQKKTPLKKITIVISTILTTSVTITCLCIVGVGMMTSHPADDNEYLSMSTQELLELNDERLNYAVTDRIWDALGKESELNEAQRTVFVIDLFDGDVNNEFDEDPQYTGLCYYLYETDIEEYNDLYDALDEIEMNEFSDNIKRFIEDNNIDVMSFNSKTEFEELYSKYPFKEFDEKSKKDYAALEKMLVNYMRNNIDKL